MTDLLPTRIEPWSSAWEARVLATTPPGRHDAGLCSDIEEQYGRSRFLKWEDFLLEEKTGNVTEIDVGCYPELEEEESNSTEECECEEESFSRWDLLKSEKYFNRTVTAEMVEQLKESWEVLGKLNWFSWMFTAKSILQ